MTKDKRTEELEKLRRAYAGEPEEKARNPLKKQVLIVDDNEALVSLLGATLGGGFECRLSLTGNDALLQLASGPLDLIVLDLNLPDLSGLEVLKAAKKRQPKAVIVVITGESPSSPKYQAALNGGAATVLNKPLPSPVELRAVLGKYLFFPAQK